MKYVPTNKWKIERDNFYYPLSLQYGFDYIVKAGFFYDTSSIHNTSHVEDSVETLCTPFGNLTKEIVSDPSSCVLISCGAFAPVHQGHIDMMKAAKKHLENNGYKVINGYFAPDHDEYVRMKCDHDAVDIFSRLSALNDAIKEDGNDWMFVDPWPGVFNNYAINFTDVITRLKYYLCRYFSGNIKIFFVCGGDNIRFVDTFEYTGNCVVVNRPPNTPEIINQWIKYCSKYADNDRIFFAYGDTEMSSTEVRKTLPKAKPIPKKLKLISSGNPDSEQSLLIANQVAYYLASYFETIELFWKKESESTFDNKTINLDKSVTADHDLCISRCYDLFGSRSLGYVARPGFVDLETQFKNIPPGNYKLYDSDSATGGTIKFVKESLAKYGVNIDSVDTPVHDADEILDVEDFILMSGDGLVIKLPNGKITRAPYMLPYVDCRERCSVLKPLELSLNMWAVNYEFFVKNSRVLGQYPQYLELFKLLGFTEKTNMSFICRWHIEMLENFA